MEVAGEFDGIGDDAMHDYLLGRPTATGEPRFLAEILKHPESAFVVDVAVPDDSAIYGPASGRTLPVVAYITFPESASRPPRPYEFPYHGAQYGAFEDMLGPGQAPGFAGPDERYPLIVLSHGAPAHGLYDVRRAHRIASYGYIVAVITYGDDRTTKPGEPNHHISYLRPLLTKAVLDALLASDTWGPHIDAENIGISGHSYGGFTALAMAGGRFRGDAATVSDARIKAASIAAPWVGGNYDGEAFHAFGPDNASLARVDIPVIGFFGSADKVALASFILPAMKHLSGPTYVVELVDQPHVFEGGSWEDRDNWELTFFAAYLKHDAEQLERLEVGGSMQGGNTDVQRFEYQSLPAR